MALKRHLWYTDLVLATMERSGELIKQKNKFILSSHRNYYQYTMIRFGAGTSVASFGRELCRLSGSGVTNNSKVGADRDRTRDPHAIKPMC